MPKIFIIDHTKYKNLETDKASLRPKGIYQIPKNTSYMTGFYM